MRAELAAVALAALSLGLKLGANDYATAMDSARLTSDIAAQLAGQGFRTTIQPRPGRAPAFIGTRGACRIYVREAPDIASYGDSYTRDAAAIGPVRYRIEGAEFDQAPTVRAWASEFGQYSRARLGLRSDRPAPLAVARSAGCPIGSPRLDALTMYMARTLER